MMVLEQEQEHRQVEALLDAIFTTYHYDFRAYVRASVERRIAHALAEMRLASVRALHERVIDDPALFARLLRHLTVQVSDLFRDPGYWRALRERVLPQLASYPFVRVWVAGCGAGEEAYSMAVLLQEEGLLERALIYATDIDPLSLERARAAAYPIERVQGFSRNYFEAGGKASLSDYYTASHASAVFAPALREHILFADHSLATDAAFAEVQLVSCRNVLIYFDRILQDRAVALFLEALCTRCFLGLGDKESLLLSGHAGRFDTFEATYKIYRKGRDA